MSDYKLTFLLSYFNQSKVLEKHIGIWNNYPDTLKKQISFQIIDDCSLKNPAKLVSLQTQRGDRFRSSR